MKNEPEGRWTIQQLVEWAEVALRELGCDRPASGRVRPVPDERTIRYYTTIGLIDRPAEMRGRVAYYGPRHLLQLVAIKKLQAEGWPLVAIQHHLAGISQTELERLAGLPDGFWTRLERAAAERRRDHGLTPPRARAAGRAAKPQRAFWKQPVATPDWGGPSGQDFGVGAVHRVGGVTRAVHLELAPGVRLVVEGALSEQWTDPVVLQQLRAAAGPLVEMVRRLRTADRAEDD